MDFGNNCGLRQVLVKMILLWFLSQIVSTQTSVITFNVSEELPAGTLVGDVKEASNISQEVQPGVLDTLQFQILSADGLRITSIFSMNSRTGVIFTNAMIDREQICSRNVNCQLEFDVTVRSDVNFVKLFTVRIVVDDINDNSPTFPKGEITLHVPESAPLNSEIPISGALDKDAGMNATLSYSLQGSDVFKLKEMKQLDGSSTLKLLLNSGLDREMVWNDTFLILAADGQEPDSRTGTLSVNVVVDDVNDNAPEFSTDVFNVTVMETSPPGTVFGQLSASDRDTGSNGVISYRFSQRTQPAVTNLFDLNTTSGELIVAAGLQYESGRSFQCVVEATDHGMPSQVSQAILYILVMDAGNTQPKLDLILADPVYNGHSAMLFENVPVGSFVGTLRVEDLDEGLEGKVNCSSLNSHFSLQRLEANRYGIVVSQELDREEQQELKVPLLCSDNGSPQLTSSASFDVLVRDVNDNAPEFMEQVYQGTVLENSDGEQTVTRLTATDKDDGANSLVTYSLDPQAAVYFAVNAQSGWITTQHNFDRERTPSVTVRVYAVDSGSPALNDSATVSVTISDVNDNSPYVNRTDYYVSENTPVGESFDINVVDEDAAENGTVEVSLPEEGRSEHETDLATFSVLANGSIVVQAPLDREAKATYTLPVLLTDRGTPRRSSTSTLTIHITDSNDHTPVFLYPTLDNNSVHITAELPAGSQVCQIFAKDLDMGGNGHVVYSISEGNSGEWFGINNQSGDIFLIRSVVDVAGSAIHLRVEATDLGTPPSFTYSFLDIVVQASNASFLALAGSEDQDRYVIIAGVIAGVTFVISVVVIAIIVHIRSSDLRRQAAMRSKERSGEGCLEDNEKKLSALCSNQVVVSDNGKSNIPPLTDGRSVGKDFSMDNEGFEPHTVPSPRGHKDPGSVLTEDALDHFSPSFPFFLKGCNRHATEDHGSDTSGDTTTFDSGRGASDEEIVFPLTGNSTEFRFAAPQIPPREPLTPTAHWSSDARLVSTNWSHVDQMQYTSNDSSRRLHRDDASDGTTPPSPAADFSSDRNRKGPMHVRFSFDDGDARSSQPYFNHGLNNWGYCVEAAAPDLAAQRQPLDSDGGQPYYNNQGDAERSNSVYPSESHQPESDQSQRIGSNFRRFLGKGVDDVKNFRELRLNLENQYHNPGRLSTRADGTPPLLYGKGLEKQQRKSVTSDSLSSLHQSLDDDVSTTTSGSYSIGLDEGTNLSLDC